MKTCPNPNCKTTGIPDDAKFCPVCGTELKVSKIVSSNQNTKVYNEQPSRSDKKSDGHPFLWGLVVSLITFAIIWLIGFRDDELMDVIMLSIMAGWFVWAFWEIKRYYFKRKR